jgi:ZIP family zinc transporter/zinc and cadmium transporter
MINVLFYSLIAGLAVIFGVYLIKQFGSWAKKNTIYLMSFAIGLLLANAFFHLLPEAVEKTTAWFYWALFAIILFYFIEHFVIIHSCQEEGCEVHAFGVTSFLGISFHSLIDGIIIGIGFGASVSIGIITAIAIIFHKTAEGIFTYSLLSHDAKTQKKSLLLSWLVAMATPLGAVLAFLFIPKLPEQILGNLLAIAAGSFIYIGASDLIPETHKKQSFINILLVILGIVFVFFVSKFID